MTVATVVTVVKEVTKKLFSQRKIIVFILFFLPKESLPKNWTTQILMKLKTQILMKLKNSNCDETQKLKLWQNLKAQIMMKLKKTRIVMKLKKLKLWWNSKTQIVMKLKITNGDKKNTNCDKTQKSNYDQTLVRKKLKSSKCCKTQILTKLK